MTVISNTSWTEEAGDQAIAWLVRVQSDAATAQDWSSLTQWLEVSPANRAAFEHHELLFAEIEDQAEAILAGLAKPSADILPFTAKTVRPAKRTWNFGRGAIAAGVAGIAALVGFGTWRASEGPLQVYRTAVGETRAITLADGSHIRMDAASTLSVRLGWFTRKVDMGDAEATFDVAKNPNRPFEIAVRDQKVRVVGTEFNIRNYDSVVNVTVRRGIVAIYQPTLSSEPIARLTPGWAMRHTVGSTQSVRDQVDPDQAFAWTQGRLVCDHQRLSEIVAYLNRRYADPIQIPRSAEGRLFTGVLALDDQGDVTRRLAAYLSLSVHRSDRNIVLS
jgi:transmembrane sensor